MAVPARRFAEIVRKLDSVDVVLEEKDGSLSIRCGRAHFQIPTMEAADFPKLPGTKGLETFTDLVWCPGVTLKQCEICDASIEYPGLAGRDFDHRA